MGPCGSSFNRKGIERIVLLEELRPQIGELRNRLGELKTGLKIEPKKERIQDLDYQMAAPGFWDDPDKAQKVAQEANNLKSEVDTFTSLETKVDDLDTLWEMAMEEKDDTLVSEMESELEGAKHTLSELELGMLLSDEYDANNAIMNLHAGAGGTEAQDWTGMLLRMFTRYAEGKGFEVELLDVLPGEEAGVLPLPSRDIMPMGSSKARRACTVLSVFLLLTPMPAATPPLRRWTLCRKSIIRWKSTSTWTMSALTTTAPAVLADSTSTRRLRLSV